MKPDVLKLQPGTTLQLQFEKLEDERLVSRVIGYNPNKSILVTTPKQEDRTLLVRLDQKVTVRFFSNTSACAFETRVINVCTHPYPYLHLAVPNEVATGEVRKARRVSSKLSANFSNRTSKTGKHAGIITDISTSGIRLTSTKEMGNKGDTVDIRTTIELEHVRRLLTIGGIIRSKTINQTDINTYIYGMEFKELLDEDFLLIYGYIYAQITENSGRAELAPLLKYWFKKQL